METQDHQHVVEFVARELADNGLPLAEARQIALAVAWDRGRFALLALAEVVAMARAIGDLPGERAWWDSADGKRSRGYLLRGRPDDATYFVAELVAPAAPDNWDPNWPPSKLFRFVPKGARLGDRIPLGNGEGARAVAVMTECDGEIGLVIDETTVRHPLQEGFHQAEAEIIELLEGNRPPE